MAEHPITWLAPQPLWTAVNAGPIPAPVILRFATDDFMAQLQNLLATDPQQLGQYRLVKETWRGIARTAPAVTPKILFAAEFQRLGATRQRAKGNGSAGISQAPAVVSGGDIVPTKVYQPAHQRYYLVSSSLVCGIAGFPDRTIDAGKQELAGFVLRRLFPKDPSANAAFDETAWPKDWIEHGWITDPSGNRWQVAEPSDEFLDGEEVLPMFGLNFQQDDQRQRRMLSGLLPVGRHDAYLAAPKTQSSDSPSAAAGTAVTALKILLRTKVIEPWKQLLDRAPKALHAATNKDDQTVNSNAVNRARINLQEASYYILVDLVDFLQTYLTPVWNPLIQSPGATDPTDAAQLAALKALRNVTTNPLTPWPAAIGGTLTSAWGALSQGRQQLLNQLPNALKQLADGSAAASLDGVKTSYDPTTNAGVSGYPSFIFPLADPADYHPNSPTINAAFPRALSLQPAPNADETEELDDTKAAEEADMPSSADALDKLLVVLTRALATMPTAAAQPAIPQAAKPPANAFKGFFVVRCVYRRPGCGPLEDDVVSQPSEPFQMAGFFDPDAPARPIRIGLPIDTSPGGLRKFDKNTAFVLSDMLCGQVKRAKGMSFGDLVMSILPFPFHKDLDGGNAPCESNSLAIGSICSLSIPIITICAFILLIIMISLLDIIFRWMPYFMICFPIPGLDSKKK